MKLQKAIETSVIEGKLIGRLTGPKTHVNRHTRRSEIQTLERALSEVRVSTSFSPDADPNFLIEEACLYHAKDIARWADGASQGDTEAFMTWFNPELYENNIGYGFTKDKKTGAIRTYKTRHLTIVIQKDTRMPLGISLITAYPSLSREHMKPTSKNLTAVMKQTPTYLQADPFDKTRLLYQADPAHTIPMRTLDDKTTGRRCLLLRAPGAEQNEIISVRINEDGFRAQKILLSHNHPVHQHIHLSNDEEKARFRTAFPELNKSMDWTFATLRSPLGTGLGTPSVRPTPDIPTDQPTTTTPETPHP